MEGFCFTLLQAHTHRAYRHITTAILLMQHGLKPYCVSSLLLDTICRTGAPASKLLLQCTAPKTWALQYQLLCALQP